MIKRQTLLSQNMLSFGRYLRQQEPFSVDAQRMSEALVAITETQISNSTIFRQTLKTYLCNTRAEWQSFDEHYDKYWRELEQALQSKIKPGPLDKSSSGKLKTYSINDIKSWLFKNEESLETNDLAAAMTGTHGSKDTTNIPEANDFQEINFLIKKWSEKLQSKYSRRKKNNTRQGILDLKKLIVSSAKGDEFKLIYKRPKLKEFNLVVLFDASRSMSMYQSFYCALIKSIFANFKRCYTYAFNTELVSTNEMFQKLTLPKTVDALEEIAGLYTSGTKIGDCLVEYLERFSSEQMSARTIVLVISDGWDTGDPAILKEAVEKMQHKCHRIIWFNPIYETGSKNLPQGMEAAFLFIDHLESVYSLETLRSFVKTY